MDSISSWRPNSKCQFDKSASNSSQKIGVRFLQMTTNFPRVESANNSFHKHGQHLFLLATKICKSSMCQKILAKKWTAFPPGRHQNGENGQHSPLPLRRESLNLWNFSLKEIGSIRCFRLLLDVSHFNYLQCNFCVKTGKRCPFSKKT